VNVLPHVATILLEHIGPEAAAAGKFLRSGVQHPRPGGKGTVLQKTAKLKKKKHETFVHYSYLPFFLYGCCGVICDKACCAAIAVADGVGLMVCNEPRD
jgi:hypothetical protein